MLFAALTFWLLVILFCAWGVHGMWSRLVKPRVVNAVLLPGTLVAQLGHLLGLLITGNPVRHAALMADEKGAPAAESPETQRVPVLGPIIVGLLPLVACASCLYLAARQWGGDVLGRLAEDQAIVVPQSLPTTLPGAWELMRTAITAAEHLLDAILRSDLRSWPTLLFLYLAVCLTVRMTPFEGNRRGAIGAILLTGLAAAALSLITPRIDESVRASWPVLSLAAAMLLFLLLASLLATGTVNLLRILARGG